ncbi:MAG: xylulokinase [Candidatus Latescibacteria bacterium]|nr:xylulokinase [Candidatus Latescibacterota bacterium]
MAKYLVGIDLGTSSVRAGIYNSENGSRLSMAARGYPINTPSSNRSEQNPEDWWKAVCEALLEAQNTAGIKGSEITGISFDGQMHGGVLLDGSGHPVCPAIIWPDSRGAGEIDELTDLIGDTLLEKQVKNRLFPGTFTSTLYWLRKHDMPVWRSIRRILPPKDYIRYRMTGLYNTEPSDASATLLFDLNSRDWSIDILKKLDIPIEFMPYVVNSDECIGETEGIEEETGIPNGIPVVIGGADQACAAFGNGLLDEGTTLITIGTGGQVCTPLASPKTSPGLCLNTFCHLPESRWYLMGATLSAGLSLRWFRETFCPETTFEQLDREASAIDTNSDLLFLPYLPGKRSPDLNPGAHGVFSGIRLHHSRGHFARAIMEGVIFDLKESFDVMEGMGITAHNLIASGGGARSRFWMQLLADIFGRPIKISSQNEQACFGTALVAGIGTGIYKNYWEAVKLAPESTETVEPQREKTERYRELYEKYLRLYRNTMSNG